MYTEEYVWLNKALYVGGVIVSLRSLKARKWVQVYVIDKTFNDLNW